MHRVLAHFRRFAFHCRAYSSTPCHLTATCRLPTLLCITYTPVLLWAGMVLVKPPRYSPSPITFLLLLGAGPRWFRLPAGRYLPKPPPLRASIAACTAPAPDAAYRPFPPITAEHTLPPSSEAVRRTGAATTYTTAYGTIATAVPRFGRSIAALPFRLPSRYTFSTLPACYTCRVHAALFLHRLCRCHCATTTPHSTTVRVLLQHH